MAINIRQGLHGGVLLEAYNNRTFLLDRVYTFWDLVYEGFFHLDCQENRPPRLVLRDHEDVFEELQRMLWIQRIQMNWTWGHLQREFPRLRELVEEFSLD